LSGVISGSGNLLKDTSSSVLTLSGANTLSGNVTVNVGTVVVTQNNGLGNNTGQTTVASGAVLDIQNASIGAETLNLNGGTLRVSTGSSSWAGPVNLGAASTLSTTGTAMTLSGLVDDNGYGVTLSGSGSFTLSNANNTINTFATFRLTKETS
jgi:autotransporter-associated beta strand protein